MIPDEVVSFNFQLDNKVNVHKRTVPSVFSALGEAGGLADILIIMGLVVHYVLVRPFEQLE